MIFCVHRRGAIHLLVLLENIQISQYAQGPRPLPLRTEQRAGFREQRAGQGHGDVQQVPKVRGYRQHLYLPADLFRVRIGQTGGVLFAVSNQSSVVKEKQLGGAGQGARHERHLSQKPRAHSRARCYVFGAEQHGLSPGGALCLQTHRALQSPGHRSPQRGRQWQAGRPGFQQAHRQHEAPAHRRRGPERKREPAGQVRTHNYGLHVSHGAVRQCHPGFPPVAARGGELGF